MEKDKADEFAENMSSTLTSSQKDTVTALVGKLKEIIAGEANSSTIQYVKNNFGPSGDSKHLLSPEQRTIVADILKGT